MEQKKEYKLYKRRWVVLLSFVCVNAVMQYGWAFFSSIVTDAWHFYGFQDAASGEAAISALTMIIMGCMIVFSIPASWVFEKIGWYKTVSIAGIVLMVFTLLRGFILVLLCFWLMPIMMGVPGIWLAVPAAETLTLLFVLTIYCRGRKRKEKLGD